jgi:DNA-binding response OmpR family regulator
MNRSARKGITVASDLVRILLVEDEPLISMTTAELLGDAGFAVEEAATAAEAMSKLTEQFAAAIIDLGLPDQPGDVLTRDVRRMWPDMPVVIASGRDRNEVARVFADDDKVTAIGKPYDTSMLLNALRGLGVPVQDE